MKQGGLLSAELYKLYIEDLLKSYENSKIGCRIGTITINAVACADGCMSNRCNFLIKMSMSTTSNADLASSNAM